MRIAVASFQHETNTFSPQLTDYNDFVMADGWPGMLRGEQVCTELAGLNIAAAGFMAAARSRHHHIIPINWCSAEPAGIVCADAFEKITGQMQLALKEAGPLDALFLDLHGAMVSENYQDGELEILRRMRAVVGPDLPIVASLDFHANFSGEFVANIDAMAIYRTYPHLDMAATGERCLQLLEQQLGEVTLCKAFVQIPFLIPLSSQHTGSAPNLGLFAQLAELEKHPSITNIEFAMGFPAADIADSGASISVFGSDQQVVDQVCQRFYQIVMAAEKDYLDPLISTTQALQIAQDSTACLPVVAADVQDNPGAGGSGDTTGMLADLVGAKAQKTVIAVLTDAQAVQLAQSAGVGETLTIELGGKSGITELRSYNNSFEVKALASGNFTCTGAMYAGCSVSIGPMALLQVVDDQCDIQILVSSLRYACTDLAVYAHLGVDPLNARLLVVKSTLHFRAAFEEISSEIVLVESPGIHPCQLAQVSYQHLRPNVRLGPMGPTFQASSAR